MVWYNPSSSSNNNNKISSMMNLLSLIKIQENPTNSRNQKEVGVTKPNPVVQVDDDDTTTASVETEDLSFVSGRASLDSFGSLAGKDGYAEESDSLVVPSGQSADDPSRSPREVPTASTEHSTSLPSNTPPPPRALGRKSFSVPPFPPPRPSSLGAKPRHRRSSSAAPRLETLYEGRSTEKPPLPPRKFSAPTSPVSGGTTRKYFEKLPQYPVSPGKPLRQGQHRRILAAPSQQPEGLFMDVASVQGQVKQLQEQYGKEHTMVAPAWNWLGNAYFRQGNVEEALQAYKRAVICGPGEHLADAYANIGTCYWTTGNVEVAIPFLQFALSEHEYNSMAQGQDPNASSAVAGVQYQLGLALTLHKDYEGALFSLNQSRAIRERLLGQSHMDVARTMDAMGKAYFLQGNHLAALDCHMRALAVKESLQNVSRTAVTGTTVMNIVEVHRAQNAFAEAVAWMHRLLASQKEEFLAVKSKALCTDIAVSLSVLGEIYDSAMKYAEGVVCYREADLYFEKARVPADDPRRAAVIARLSA